MKLTLTQYIEPLAVEIEKADGTTETVELELNFCDSNVFESEKLAKKIVEAAGDLDGDPEEQAKKLAELIVPSIDLLAGDGASGKLAKAFGCNEPSDCVSGLVEIWKAFNQECTARAGKSRVSAVSRYLDANA